MAETEIWRITEHHGVYRCTTTQSSPFDDLRAAWLTTNPEALALERIDSSRPDAVVASAAAAMVHGMGDVSPASYRIIVPSRGQTARGAIAYSWRAFHPRDVEVVDGLPVSTRERTIVDLFDDEGDVSIAADALRDAVQGKYDLDETHLAALLALHAERLGRTAGDGSGAVAFLMVTAEVDAVSLASRALEQVLKSKTPVPGIEAFVNKVILSTPALSAMLPVESQVQDEARLADRGLRTADTNR